MIVNLTERETFIYLDKMPLNLLAGKPESLRMDGADLDYIHLSVLLCNCGCCQGVHAESEGNIVTLSTRHPTLDLCQKNTIHCHCVHAYTGLYAAL